MVIFRNADTMFPHARRGDKTIHLTFMSATVTLDSKVYETTCYNSICGRFPPSTQRQSFIVNGEDVFTH